MRGLTPLQRRSRCILQLQPTGQYTDLKVKRVLFQAIQFSISTQFKWGGCPRGVMVKAMDCGIVVREFVLLSRYYVHFRENTLGKGMNLIILHSVMDYMLR